MSTREQAEWSGLRVHRYGRCPEHRIVLAAPRFIWSCSPGQFDVDERGELILDSEVVAATSERLGLAFVCMEGPRSRASGLRGQRLSHEPHPVWACGCASGQRVRQSSKSRAETTQLFYRSHPRRPPTDPWVQWRGPRRRLRPGTGGRARAPCYAITVAGKGLNIFRL